MPTRNGKGLGKLILFFIFVAVVAIAVGAFRLHSSWALRREAKDNDTIEVSVIAPKKGPAEEELVLPADIQPWHQAVIYGRVNGYVKNWYTPFGSHVHKGQTMAELETPELDAQLRQAEADVNTADANNTLAQITAKRWKALSKTQAVSKQEVDEKIGDAAAKKAALASAIASRDHLREEVGFKLLRAPFDGVVTARLLDIGLLVNGSIEQQPLFRLVQQDRLRVYIKVPQNYSARINPSVYAELHLPEHPGEIFRANYYRNAKAMDPATRTLEVEMVVDNKDDKLLSGGYGEAHIKLPSSKTSLRLPVNALIFRAAGLQVAIVNGESKAVLKKVVMGRDFGNEVEISSGLEENDRVVINPPDSLADGQEVRVKEPKKEEPKAAPDESKKDEPGKDTKKP